MLTACYDLECSPASYDFVSWLVGAEMERLERNEDSLQILILPGPDQGFRASGLPPTAVVERRQMRDQVMVPMAGLLPSCVNCEVRQDRRIENHDGRFGLGEMRYGLGVKMKASERGIFPLRAKSEPERADYATITLRETPYWTERNSNIAEWLAVAGHFIERGLKVIFVRDAFANDDGPMAALPNTCRAAATDLNVRASLYAGSRLNMFVNNGPAWLSWYMNVPTLICKLICESSPATRARFFERHGLVPGQQMPNALPWQRLLWADDTRAAIIPVAEAMLA